MNSKTEFINAAKSLHKFKYYSDSQNRTSLYFYPLFEEKVGIVLLSGSEVGLESELSFEVP